MGEENAISCFLTLDTISWFLPSPISVWMIATAW